MGACHHQKALIVDDEIAFVGGGDIAPDRWDTPEHLDDDPRRAKRRFGRGHGVFDARHEMMLAMDGDAACAMGRLFRERWFSASRQRLPDPKDDGVTIEPADLWPEGLAVDARDVRIGIARTLPQWKAQAEVREAEALHLSAIADAKSLIYMENQYFASPVIAEALAERLAEPGGPEVVLVSTLHSPSYFDQITMDRTRLAFLKRLKDADAEGRRAEGRAGASKLHAFCPVTAKGRPIIVHAKVTVIDDRMLRIGSCNINNRSTGFDTECDVALEAQDGRGGRAVRAAVRAWRTRMVAHWLGKPAAAVDAALARGEGLAAAIAQAGRSGRARGCGRWSRSRSGRWPPSSPPTTWAIPAGPARQLAALEAPRGAGAAARPRRAQAGGGGPARAGGRAEPRDGLGAGPLAIAAQARSARRPRDGEGGALPWRSRCSRSRALAPGASRRCSRSPTTSSPPGARCAGSADAEPGFPCRVQPRGRRAGRDGDPGPLRAPAGRQPVPRQPRHLRARRRGAGDARAGRGARDAALAHAVAAGLRRRAG